MAAHGKSELEGGLERGEPEFAEPDSLRHREPGVGEVGKHVASPQPLRICQHADGPIEIARTRRPIGLPNQSLEAPGVNLVGVHVDQIAVAFGAKHPRTQNLA